MTTLRTVLWQRLDEPGMEYATISRISRGYQMDGTVLNTVEGLPAQLRYQVRCNTAWHTQMARIEAWLPGSRQSISLNVDAQRRWWRDGVEIVACEGCIDVDLAFSPLTNTLAIQRLRLRPGEKSTVPAAWVRYPTFMVETLPQRYTRLTSNRYRYESLKSGFETELQVDDMGLIVLYPELWKRVG